MKILVVYETEYGNTERIAAPLARRSPRKEPPMWRRWKRSPSRTAKAPTSWSSGRSRSATGSPPPAESCWRVRRALFATPETRFAGGNAAVAVLEAAADEPSTLVAVGSRGLGPARRVALGSVSTKLLRTTEGPILVHPRPGS
jgi:hypothetical protein